MQRQLVRFLAVGIINASLDLGVYTGLTIIGVGLIAANTASTLCGLVFSFFANRSFTFDARSAQPIWRQALTFLIVVGFGLWVIQPLVILAVTPLWAEITSDALLVAAAKATAIGVALVWNFILLKLVVFRAQEQNEDRPAEQ